MSTLKPMSHRRIEIDRLRDEEMLTDEEHQLPPAITNRLRKEMRASRFLIANIAKPIQTHD